ncbi:MAG: hypothetical protein L0I76_33850 [Pseudonocardia sp.]|nr:hypothetical protein [Pseudonocardia sp.]
MKVTTLLTAADDCPNKWDCPSVHDLDVDPERRYVVSKQASDDERGAFAHLVGEDEVVGWLPDGLLDERNSLLDRTREVRSPLLHRDRRYVITTAVSDESILAAFGDLVGRKEQLGSVAVHQLAVI